MSKGASRSRWSLGRLKAFVSLLDVPGSWEQCPESCWQFQTEDGASLIWSPFKCALHFEGDELAICELALALMECGLKCAEISDAPIHLSSGEVITRVDLLADVSLADNDL